MKVKTLKEFLDKNRLINTVAFREALTNLNRPLRKEELESVLKLPDETSLDFIVNSVHLITPLYNALYNKRPVDAPNMYQKHICTDIAELIELPFISVIYIQDLERLYSNLAKESAGKANSAFMELTL